MKPLNYLIASLTLSFLFIMTAPAPRAFGAEPVWVVLDEGNDSAFSYDKSAPSKVENGKIRVKTRVVYTKEGKRDALKILSPSKNLDKLYETRYQHELDCGEKESRLLDVTHLDQAGVTLKHTDLSASTEWEAIPPETRMEMVAERVCEK